MAYHYDGIAQTQKGSIIYKRKKHRWSGKDMGRIIKAIGFPTDIRETYDWLQASLTLLVLLQRVPHGTVSSDAVALISSLATYIATAEEFEGFGGGEYGGGGASGTFLQPLPVYDISEGEE